jgi:hypothetical protein
VCILDELEQKRSAYSRAACSMNFFALLSVSTSARTVSASRTISPVKRAMWSAALAGSRWISWFGSMAAVAMVLDAVGWIVPR